MGEWQTITTAPKDGTRFLAWDGKLDRCVVIYWFESCDIWLIGYGAEYPAEPTHWMPLPAPPKVL